MGKGGRGWSHKDAAPLARPDSRPRWNPGNEEVRLYDLKVDCLEPRKRLHSIQQSKSTLRGNSAIIIMIDRIIYSFSSSRPPRPNSQSINIGTKISARGSAFLLQLTRDQEDWGDLRPTLETPGQQIRKDV